MAAGRDGFIPPYMDAATLAAHICTSVETIEAWMRQGLFPPPRRKIGHKRLWSWAEVEQHLSCQPISANGQLPDPEAERVRANVQRLLDEQPTKDRRRKKTEGVTRCPDAKSPSSEKAASLATIHSLRSSERS